MLVDITCTINGRERNLAVEATELLVDTLRLRLGLTGTKKACGTGDCGACTVIVDGEAVRSCILLTASMHGKSITTIEGLGGVSTCTRSSRPSLTPEPYSAATARPV